MPMATDTLALPNTFPTTVGMVEKNPPLATPLTTTNSTSGPSDVEAGQMVSMLTAVAIMTANSVFRGPRRSQKSPQPMRPAAEARLKPARRPAPAPEGRSSWRVKSGRKNGGTKSGKVPMALARKMMSKVKDLKRRLFPRVRLHWLGEGGKGKAGREEGKGEYCITTRQRRGTSSGCAP